MGQAGKVDDNLTLEIILHPAIRGCCILTILDSKSSIIRAAIIVNNSELKKVADMLMGISNVDIEGSQLSKG